MARAGVANVITFVRGLVDDAASATWTDDQVQTALDRYRQELRYEQTYAIPTRSSTGTSYKVFDVPDGLGYLETDLVLYDNEWGTLTGTAETPDYTRGRFTFTAEPGRPVYVLGWSHDPYMAAADLLEQRIATMLDVYDVTLGPDSFSRSQMIANYRTMVTQYRGMSRKAGGLVVAHVERVDVY